MPKKVKLYTLSTCSHCKATKKFLNENNIPFESTEIDLLQGKEREDAINDVMQYNPLRSFPTIVIGSIIIVGFKENDLREALGI